MKEYTFTYYGWIPGYNDFDQDWVSVHAESESEARSKVKTRVRFAKSDVELVSVEEIK